MIRLLLSFLLIFPVCAFAQQTITTNDIDAAAKIAGLTFTDAEKDSMLQSVRGRAMLYEKMHEYNLDNSSPYSLHFSPLLAGMKIKQTTDKLDVQLPKAVMPKRKEDLAFMSIAELASLIKSRKISSTELTRFFIDRLKRYGDTLQCVVTITEEMALEQAKIADREIAQGKWRGMLHGIPYGLKDLFAVRGTKTTWGARPYKDQVIETDSYVYTKLKDAGAILVAKLTTGALAMGDYWYGGRTKNPWDLTSGSSGSSAGSASATVAGLVPFAIGTETYGSIISPAMICGATGLRPTFGSISRHGAMTLSWSLDKPGPLCRSADDAAIVFYYLQGTDGRDASAVSRNFHYDPKIDLSKLRIGYAVNYFKGDAAGSETELVRVLEQAGAKVTPVVFPDSGVYHFNLMSTVLSAEAAAAFDGFTRSGLDDEMDRQGRGEWPNYFRAARLIPAVEYINGNRHRYLLMEKVNEVMTQYDVIICPSWGGNQLAITNLTGHPAVCFPTGFSQKNLPTGLTLVGNLYDEATLLAVARVYQEATNWNKVRPEFFVE